VIVHLVASVDEGQPPDPDDEDRRVDHATAAALLYVGDIGWTGIRIGTSASTRTQGVKGSAP
jgi:hypothetical protein